MDVGGGLGGGDGGAGVERGREGEDAIDADAFWGVAKGRGVQGDGRGGEFGGEGRGGGDDHVVRTGCKSKEEEERKEESDVHWNYYK